MVVSELIVKILEKEGITDAFGIPGAGINGLYKYLKDSAIKHYTVRHEEAAVHAAGAYYRASGRLAAAICTSGPGATNFVTGLYTANIDSIPLIAITGQAVTAQLGKDAFQCVDIAAIAAPVAKKTWCVTDKESVADVFREAFRVAREGKPGPVVIDLPLDVQNAETSRGIEPYAPDAPSKPAPDARDIQKAAAMLREAKSPVIIMGGGVIEAGAADECIALAEHLQIPVITTYMAKGGIPEGHPLNAGHAGIQVGQPIGNKTLLGSDLVLGAGCRFTDRHTGAIGPYKGDRRFIHINIEKSEIGKIIAADVGIVADAKLALAQLLAEAKKQPPVAPGSAPERVRSLPSEREALRRKTDQADEPIHPHRVFGEMNKAFGPDTLFTTGCGITQIWSGQLQQISRARRYLPSGGSGTLGYDIPAAFGAAIANPGKKAVAVMGDFGFTFHVQELATCAKYGVPVIVVIVNNAYLGLIRQNQKYAYKYEYAVEMRENHSMVDYVKVAQGLGGDGERVFKPGDLGAAMRRAQESSKPYVLDIVVQESADCSMGNSIDAVREF
ncbi:MAG: glyoxylate carboligase [Clostridiales bacterium]|jgi:tartronate-semialdehyde synthase|nr:glyoxylate carboligase [Clostridiales bacterium]